jgi:tripartite-type tricarboxylate transporter receptor subunit TctC
MRKLVTALVGAAVATSAATPLAAQPARYPTRGIEIVVAYGPGGSTDLVARALAQKFQERLGQSAVVINKPGASGALGATQAARSDPDGHTLFAGFTTETVVVPQLSRNAKYSIDDFEPIAVTGIVPVMLIGSRNVRANSLPELIEDIRRSPGKLTYGGRLGSPSHILGAWLNRLKGLEVTHIPYRGGAQAVADIAGGHVDLFFAGVTAAKSAVDAGLIKVFAVVADARSSALPNVPTFKESGVADFDLGSWTVLLAPQGTPPEIIGILRQETALALNDPQVRTSLVAQGVEPSPTQDVRAFVNNERDKFGRVIRELGISLEQ